MNHSNRLLLETMWQEDALCAQREHQGVNWFPEDHLSPRQRGDAIRYARSICCQCPVVAECHSYAERAMVTAGIWAGRDYNRQTMVKRHRKSR